MLPLSSPPAEAPAVLSSTRPSPGARAAILHAAEAAATQSVGRPVRLGRSSRFAVDGRWAFVIAPLREANGEPFHYPAGTPQVDAAAHGTVSRDYVVLLSSSGPGWSVVAAAVGPTDAVWQTWPATYGAPARLFQGDR